MGVAPSRIPEQAAGLGRAPTREGPPVLVVASGKGGVGKTFLAVNLTLSLGAQGWPGAMVDLDWGLGNLDVALGVAPQRHLGHVLAGECTVAEALVEHEGFTLLPNACGEEPRGMSLSLRMDDLAAAIAAARPACRVLVADTHPGIGPATVDTIRQASVTVVVSTTEPTAITDTYALLKVLSQAPPRGAIGLVINQAASPERAFEAARHLNLVTQRFLRWEVPCWGFVPLDPAVPQSVHLQVPLLRRSPRGRTAAAVRDVAATVRRLLEGGQSE